eukprot:scpid96207/ scgid24840/ 
MFIVGKRKSYPSPSPSTLDQHVYGQAKVQIEDAMTKQHTNFSTEMADCYCSPISGLQTTHPVLTCEIRRCGYVPRHECHGHASRRPDALKPPCNPAQFTRSPCTSQYS